MEQSAHEMGVNRPILLEITYQIFPGLPGERE